MAGHGWRVRVELVVHDLNDELAHGRILIVPGPTGWRLPGGFVGNKPVRVALAEHVHAQTGLTIPNDLRDLAPVTVLEVNTGHDRVLVFQHEAAVVPTKPTSGRWFALLGDQPPAMDRWFNTTMFTHGSLAAPDRLPFEVPMAE
ncbi:hypothetical protein [Sciscionella marina]|uniref:hypothetical protein n=1 Tax=Sciscionella marina TaxID=508770 RepID=UPI00036784E0|nr:hypothetical protein [Sciscionella marina]